MFRVSPDEKKAIQQAAGIEETPVAAWVRGLVRTKLRELGLLPEVKLPPKMKKAPTTT